MAGSCDWGNETDGTKERQLDTLDCASTTLRTAQIQDEMSHSPSPRGCCPVSAGVNETYPLALSSNNMLASLLEKLLPPRLDSNFQGLLKTQQTHRGGS